MAVKIRLTRIGKKRQPSYRVVVADARSPRDGAYIEQIGRYDPRQEPSIVEIDNERASYWIDQGAQPSSQVKKLLEISGAVAARPVRQGRIHVVGEAAQHPSAASDAAVAAASEPTGAEVHVVGEAAQLEAATTDDAVVAAAAAAEAANVVEVTDEAGEELADEEEA